jgi:tRNA(Arg) A34 adenosine deaminase TadA
MHSLADFTALSFTTGHPTVYGAEIVDTKTGKSLQRSLNAVSPLHDPSAHAEVYTIRLACAQLKSPRLQGYTLYTTCEPCPMCMACILWSGLDRVVYGATIDDAARFGDQIMIYAKDMQKKWDHPCIVDGPVGHDRCLALFTDPSMQAEFKRWKAH